MDLRDLDIAALVRIARARLGMTQIEFGNKLKVSQKTISSWENGNSMPSAWHFRKILKILGEIE